MPIHRQKMDDDGEEDDGRGSNVFHPSNGVVGLREVPTRNASMAMKEAAGEGLTGASVVASSKNSGNANEVGQMIVAALQQIDSVIAETGRSMETSSSSDVINANVVVDGKVNSNQPSPDNGSNAFHSLDTFEPGNTTSVKLSSSSSSDCSNSESMASDLGVLPDNQDPLTPTSPTASGSISTGDSRYTVNGGQQRSIDCTDSVASSIFVQQLSVRLAETLNRMSSPSSSVVENGGNALSVLPKPDPVVAHVLLRWLRAHDETRSPSPSMSTVSCPEYVDLQDKLHRLETDRESLSLQVSVLNEQVGAQSDKIKDLESLLDDKRRKLDSAEEMLHDELTTRSGLETDRLDLLSEISQLKLKLASLERDKISTQHRLRSAQGDIQSLQRVMQERYNELVTQAQQQQARPSPHPSAATKAPAAAVDPAGEIEHLRSAVQHLMSENAEKEQRIEQMRMLMERQLLRNPNASLNGHSVGGRSTDSDASGGSAAIPYAHRSASVGSGTMMGTSSLSNVSLVHFHQRPRAPHVNDAQQQLPVDINQQLRQLLSESDGGIIAGNLPSTSLPSSASFPETFLCTSRPPAYPSVYLHGIGGPMQPSTSCTANLSSKVNAAGVSESGSSVPAANWSAPVTPQHQQTNASTLGTAHSSTAARQLAAELNELIPQYRRSSSGVYNTGSLPRGVGQVQSPTKKRSDSCAVNSGECRPTARQPKRGLKWLLHLKATSKRSTSAPNLGRLEDDADGDECRNGAAMDSDEEGTPSRQPNEKLKREKKQKSLKTLISRLKRSNSQEFSNGDVDPGSDFRRGGFVRATAGPRLRSWSREPHAQRSIPIRPSVEQFGKWTSEEVADWLNEIGLTMYVSDCRKNVRSGRHMMALTPADMERELGIKNPLHKKKLVIAMRNIELGKPEPGDQLDYHQVLRWLDDVGLPQYRDVFAEHRIDGSSLNLLIVDDLLQMRITSALHHATIARGIQILRMVGFNLNRFIRKFNPDVISKCPLPNQVQLWSQHCITEWLRSIDLTEFTPNLMCAGIHGALMVLEPTFTAESLACVLQIPTQKTLLRRHLTTHFNQLLGQEIIAGKREALSVPFAVQLVPGLKVKAAKRGFSLARRKHNRTEVYMEPDDLVCPLTPNRKPPSSAALLERLPESISEQMLSSLSSSNV